MGDNKKTSLDKISPEMNRRNTTARVTNMESIIFLRPRSANYTPRSLMCDFTRVDKKGYTKVTTSSSNYGEVVLHLLDMKYVYDHWQVDSSDGDIDRVTLFLKE